MAPGSLGFSIACMMACTFGPTGLGQQGHPSQHITFETLAGFFGEAADPPEMQVETRDFNLEGRWTALSSFLCGADACFH